MGTPHIFKDGSPGDVEDHPDSTWIGLNAQQLSPEDGESMLADSVVVVLHHDDAHSMMVLDDGEPARLTFDSNIVVTGAVPMNQ